VTTVEVRLWGERLGAALLDGQRVIFEYDQAAVRRGLEVSPVKMPLSSKLYEFHEVESFQGLPGLLADSLPDRFGNTLIDSWLASQGRSPESFTVLDRLCYIGKRGMGALEFHPLKGPRRQDYPIEIEEIAELANQALNDKQAFQTSMKTRQRAVKDILSIGTSAGGARAKAVIAWNRETDEIRSGQLDTGPGFEHWLIKFDGVRDPREQDLDSPMGYGLIEYAYHLMAAEAGIQMSECRLLKEGGRAHFMSKRFDRNPGKVHMQSLAALAHLDFNYPTHSYEQAFLVSRQIELPMADLEEQFRRMVFNVMARNQDDHVKNIAYLMGEDGQWRLSPAFDLTFAYNPEGRWTSKHQMSVNGSRNPERADLIELAAAFSLRRRLVDESIEQVEQAVERWGALAEQTGVPEDRAQKIAAAFRSL
jgi:serine/threonine-protein kinase HipA